MERRVFTYKDVEEAKKYIGKSGVFGDNLAKVSSGEVQPPHVRRGVLLYADSDRPAYPFESESAISRNQFFSPDPEPVEKWVPFTAEDVPSLHLKAVRMKGWVAGAFRTVVGWDALNKGIDTGGLYVSPEDLFRYWEFIDGAPCGKKVTE